MQLGRPGVTPGSLASSAQFIMPGIPDANNSESCRASATAFDAAVNSASSFW
jgi:hypothetical protein